MCLTLIYVCPTLIYMCLKLMYVYLTLIYVCITLIFGQVTSALDRIFLLAGQQSSRLTCKPETHMKPKEPPMTLRIAYRRPPRGGSNPRASPVNLKPF